MRLWRLIVFFRAALDLLKHSIDGSEAASLLAGEGIVCGGRVGVFVEKLFEEDGLRLLIILIFTHYRLNIIPLHSEF